MACQLHYWPSIQGRGEFVRLALEAVGAEYVDVARQPGDEGGGAENLLKLMSSPALPRPPFAPPLLIDGDLVIGQTANILLYLGARHGLAPPDEAGRLWVNQLQLTIADLVLEAHDTHHPLDSGQYYEDQKPEAARRAKAFREQRLPKYLGWFERVLATAADNGGGAPWLAGPQLSYADLSLFQVIEGLAYAFPGAMAQFGADAPRVLALKERVAALPRIAAYLKSTRRIAFNEMGIFRRYPELDRP